MAPPAAVVTAEAAPEAMSAPEAAAPAKEAFGAGINCLNAQICQGHRLGSLKATFHESIFHVHLARRPASFARHPRQRRARLRAPPRVPGKGPPAACQTLLSFEVVLYGEVSKASQLKMTNYTAVYRKVRTASLKLVELLCCHLLEKVLRELES